MTTCGYCKDKITLAPNGFSGLEDKFCQTCWTKIALVNTAFQIMQREPNIVEWASLIKTIS